MSMQTADLPSKDKHNSKSHASTDSDQPIANLLCKPSAPVQRLLIRGLRIILIRMGKKADAGKSEAKAKSKAAAPAPARPSALLDTRVIYCGDCLEQLKNLPDA